MIRNEAIEVVHEDERGRVYIMQDDDPCADDPRDWDNLAHLVCWHRH